MHKFRIPHRRGDAGPHVAPGSHDPRSEMIIDRCPACQGFWVDRGELEHVLEHGVERMAELKARASHTRPPDRPREARLKCPRDGASLVEMTDLRQGHIRYDMCPKCGGIFFDAGELTDLSAHTLAERVRGIVRRLRE